MNNQERLFKNTFIRDLDQTDIPFNKKEEFKKFHENRIDQQRRQAILSRSEKHPPKFSNPGKPNNDTYSDLARFQPNHSIPLHLLRQENKEARENVKIEKKTIVSIDSRNRDINKYPHQNDFTVFLGKTFFNVKRVELVSTEFPNTDQVIKAVPLELQNNLITWQNQEDYDLNFFTGLTINTIIPDTIDITLIAHGYTINSSLDINIYNSKLDTDVTVTGIIDGSRRVTVLNEDTFRFTYIGGILTQGTANIDLGFPQYSVEIKPGNYTASTLSDQMSKDLGLVKSRNGNGEFHFFEVKVNLDTDVMTLDSVRTTQLPNNSLSTIAGSTTITVNQNGHGFKTGDRVKMIGVKNTAGIIASNLNGDFIVNVLDFNTFTYEVIIRASDTLDGGGNTIRTGKDAPFRLLFDTENTKIQFNTGFPDENSSEYIGTSNPITTKALSISDVNIISPTKLRFTTTENHELVPVQIRPISNISIGNNPTITTSIPHDIELPVRVTLRNTNSIPPINGTFFGVPTGIFTFILQGLQVMSPGTTGELLYGPDIIKIFKLQTVPSILIDPIYFIENVPAPNQFDITFRTTSVDIETIPDTIIGTSQVFINHPSHNFNELSSITALNGTFANIKTYLPHNLVGSRTLLVALTDGPVSTNTVDILLPKHGLSTSDQVIIRDSTSDPIVNGTFKIQVVDSNTIRFNFIHDTFIDGTATILTGDTAVITHSNSLPRINGSFSLHNRELISNIAAGILTSVITTTTINNWSVGDIVTISGSNSFPSIDGLHTIQSIISPVSFEIDLVDEVVSSGTEGIVINNNRFEIETGFLINSPGSNPAGILGRNNQVIHYRIEGEAFGSDNIGDIQLNVLNGNVRTVDRLIDNNNYMIRVTGEFASKTLTSGGINVRVSSTNHGLRPIQANTDTGTPAGALFRSISLEGENYVYLTSQSDNVELNSVLNTANISNTFAKILLSESPGNMMFNSFISEPKVFDNPIAKIDTMRFQIVTPEGFLFNFNDIDYSFTLRITELVDQLEQAFISSRTGNTEFTNYTNTHTETTTNTNTFGSKSNFDLSSGSSLALRIPSSRGSSRII